MSRSLTSSSKSNRAFSCYICSCTFWLRLFASASSFCLRSLSWFIFTTSACSRSGRKASGSSYLYISFMRSKACWGLIRPQSFLQAFSPSFMIFKWPVDCAAEAYLPPRKRPYTLSSSSPELAAPGSPSPRSQAIWKETSLTLPEASSSSRLFFLRSTP